MSTATPQNPSSDVPPDDDVFGAEAVAEEESLDPQAEGEAQEGEEGDEPDADLDRKFLFFQAAPAWSTLR